MHAQRVTEVRALHGDSVVEVLCVLAVDGEDRLAAQVKALCENLEEKMEENGVFARRKEGAETGRWIVIDYLNVVVHIFHHETREFYQLDKLWNNGNNVVDYGE